MIWYVVSHKLGCKLGVKDYRRLDTALNQIVDCYYPLRALWLVKTSLTPEALTEALLNCKAIENLDEVIILELTGSQGARLIVDKDVTAWIGERLTPTRA